MVSGGGALGLGNENWQKKTALEYHPRLRRQRFAWNELQRLPATDRRGIEKVAKSTAADGRSSVVGLVDPPLPKT